MSNGNEPTVFSRNVRFLRLAALFLPALAALAAYDLMPHEKIWHEVLYSLICVPIFCVWLIALVGCIISFLVHRFIVRP